MNALEELEQRLGIERIDLCEIATGMDYTIPTLPKYGEKSIDVPNIKQRTFARLDASWNVQPHTAEKLYNQLCDHLRQTHNEEQVAIINTILASMQCGNLSKTKLNDLLTELSS